MENFGKNWFISASSGILGKILLVVFCFGAGVVGGQFISVPIDKYILKDVVFIVSMVIAILAFGGILYVPLILEWLARRRESENENLKLKLELQRLKVKQC